MRVADEISNFWTELEGKVIQGRIKQPTSKIDNYETLSKRFAQLMTQRDVNPTIRLLDQETKSGILPLSEDTMQCLQKKTIQLTVLKKCCYKKINDTIYEDINAELIQKYAQVWNAYNFCLS